MRWAVEGGGYCLFFTSSVFRSKGVASKLQMVPISRLCWLEKPSSEVLLKEVDFCSREKTLARLLVLRRKLNGRKLPLSLFHFAIFQVSLHPPKSLPVVFGKFRKPGASSLQPTMMLCVFIPPEGPGAQTAQPIHSRSNFTYARPEPRLMSSSPVCSFTLVLVSADTGIVHRRSGVPDRSVCPCSHSHLFVAAPSSKWIFNRRTFVLSNWSSSSGTEMASPARGVMLAPSWGRASAKLDRMPHIDSPTPPASSLRMASPWKGSSRPLVFTGQMLWISSVSSALALPHRALWALEWRCWRSVPFICRRHEGHANACHQRCAGGTRRSVRHGRQDWTRSA